MKPGPRPVPDDLAESLDRRLRKALRAHLLPHAQGPFSVTLAIEGPVLAGPPPLNPGESYWSQPSRHHRLFGRGVAFSSHTQGEDRLTLLSRHFSRAVRGWQWLDPEDTGARPLMFVGFGFAHAGPMAAGWEGFPNACLTLPEVLVHQYHDSCRLVFSCNSDALEDSHRQIRRWLDLAAPLFAAPGQPDPPPPSPGAVERIYSDPPGHQWLVLAARALEQIHRHRLKKLVLYRRVGVRTCSTVSIPDLVARLERSYPDCRLYAIAQGGATLVSASPERLVAKLGRNVVSDVLAGTAARSLDRQRDQGLARGLQQSVKARLEHRLVADAVRQALLSLCSEIADYPAPTLRRLANVQHLWNEVRGTVQGPANLLDIAARLHPTPAVGGSPREPALRWLQRHGQDSRGWYSGAAGWIDIAGDGELDVLLRCALVRDHEAEIYAGAGLVAGSDPAAELRETELKLRAVLDALGNA